MSNASFDIVDPYDGGTISLPLASLRFIYSGKVHNHKGAQQSGALVVCQNERDELMVYEAAGQATKIAKTIAPSLTASFNSAFRSFNEYIGAHRDITQPPTRTIHVVESAIDHISPAYKENQNGLELKSGHNRGTVVHFKETGCTLPEGGDVENHIPVVQIVQTMQKLNGLKQA